MPTWTRLTWFSCLLARSSIQAVDVEAVAVTVKELVSYALTLNANNQSWLITQADIYFGEDERRIFYCRENSIVSAPDVTGDLHFIGIVFIVHNVHLQ